MAETVQEGALIKREPLFCGKLTSVLNIEFATYRHAKFRVKGPAVFVRYVDDMRSAMKDLQERDWDIIFMPGWFPSQHYSLNNPTERDLVRVIMEKTRKPKLVVYTGYTDYQTDELKMLYKLRDVGILLAHVPWNHDDPSLHVRKPIPFPKPETKE